LSLVTLQTLSKRFNDSTVVQDVNLEIQSGEFFSVLGPSGCGKTTLLRMIAGFEQPTSGTIFINGHDVTKALPQARGIGMVFQNYALFPHMTVFGNVAFGLETKGLPRNEIRERVEKILEAVNLSHKQRIPVPQLSGGEQQRVAVARALVVEPSVLLMDEPLSNLDVALRLKTREEIRALQRRIGITTIYVTHDQSEAMSLSDRVAVMKGGKIVQVGQPAEVYEVPASPFVAEFLGGANVLKGRVAIRDLKIFIGSFAIAVPSTTLANLRDGNAALVVKPEAVILTPPGQKGEYEALITHKEYLGFTTNFVVQTNGVTLRVTAMTSALTKQLRIGTNTGVSFDWSRCVLLPQES
jgi:ABC-type Fe3+/spermidine/putrescine transport system ATPase subunit